MREQSLLCYKTVGYNVLLLPVDRNHPIVVWIGSIMIYGHLLILNCITLKSGNLLSTRSIYEYEFLLNTLLT